MPASAESILDSVKKSLGLEPELTAFDLDITMHINAVFTTLHQLGVGAPGFSISDRTATWGQFYAPGSALDAVRTYVYMRVRLIFDPPASAYAIQSFEKMCEQLEWRLNVQVETEVLNATLQD